MPVCLQPMKRPADSRGGSSPMLSTTDTFCVERRAGNSRPAANARFASIRRVFFGFLALFALAAPMMAAEAGEANLKLPDLRTAAFLGGINGHNLLLGGLVVSALGL